MTESLQELGNRLQKHFRSLHDAGSVHFQVSDEVVRTDLRFTQSALYLSLSPRFLFPQLPPLVHICRFQLRPALRLGLLPVFLHMLQSIIHGVKTHVAVATGHSDVWPEFREGGSVGLEVRIEVVIVPDRVPANGTSELLDVLVDSFDMPTATHVSGE